MTTELAWRQSWESALALWGVALHDPELVAVPAPPSFAWFAFPPEITIDVPALRAAGADAELESVFAHEIGHHVLSPSTRLDSLKIRHQIGRALQASGRPGDHHLIQVLSNVWSDQLINMRVASLQRLRTPDAEPGMIRLWRQLTPEKTQDRFTWVRMRAYEVTWALPPGTFCSRDAPAPDTALNQSSPVTEPDPPGTARQRRRARQRELRASRAERAKAAAPRTAVEVAEAALMAATKAEPEVDARLLARLVKVFAHDPVAGALPFGLLAAPYLSVGHALGDDGLGCAGESNPALPTAAEIGHVLGDPRLAVPPVHPAAAMAPDAALEAPQSSSGQALGLAETLMLFDESQAESVVAPGIDTRRASGCVP